MTKNNDDQAEALARHLILDDLSRAPEVPVEMDGAKAVERWISGASQAGDRDTLDDISAVGEQALADAWDEIVLELV